MDSLKKLFKSTIDGKIKISSDKQFSKAISEYLNPNNPFSATPPEGFSPDLQYNTSILVSEGTNKNSDVFLRNILCAIFKTPRHKLVNYEHDTHAQNEFKNPNEYKVVGHIYDSALSTQDGRVIPEWDVFYSDIDSKWFPKDSPWRGLPLDIKVAWVLYQFEYPELAELILEESRKEFDDGFGVSMEILFSDYKFRIGAPVNPEEDFSFDGNSIDGVIEVSKGHPLADLFQSEWNYGKYRTWQDKKVVRILGGEIFFSGMAITGNRANTRSINLATAEKAVASVTSDSISKIIKAVASKQSNVDLSTCQIVNGEPDCGCLENTIAAQLELLSKEISELSEIVNKRGNASSASKAVKLNKPMKGDVKKYKVYVKNDKGNVVKVNFGDPNMEIKRDNPARKKSFRARHKCDSPGPKWKPRYWSCKFWSDKPVSELLKGSSGEIAYPVSLSTDIKMQEIQLIETVFGMYASSRDEWIKKVYTDSFNYSALSDSFLEKWNDYINTYIVKLLLSLELDELFETISSIQERNNPFIEDILYDIAVNSFGDMFDMDMDGDEEEEDEQDYLKLANDKLHELYENNIDNELSKEEVVEYLELVEKYLLKSRSLLLKPI